MEDEESLAVGDLSFFQEGGWTCLVSSTRDKLNDSFVSFGFRDKFLSENWSRIPQFDQSEVSAGSGLVRVLV